MARKPVDVGQRWKPKATGIGPEYGLSVVAPAPALPERAGALPERLQALAREYIGARHKSGQAFLDACRWLSEARIEAKHGEWQIFLEATSTSAATAKRMLDTHATAMRDSQFAEAVRNDWIGATMAGALAQPSISDETRADLLGQKQPPKITDIPKVARKTTRMVDLDQALLPDMPAPASPTELPAEYAIIQRRFLAHGIALLSNMQGQHRAFVTRKEGMTGVVTFDWADVLSKLERLEGQAAPEIAPAEQNPNYSDVVAPPAAAPASTAAPINGWWNCGSELRAISAAIGAGDRLGATRAALHLAVVIIGDALLDYGGLMSEAEYESLRRLVKRERDAA